MTRAIYSLLMWLVQPFVRVRLRYRGVAEPGYRVAMNERFGHYENDAADVDNIDDADGTTPRGGYVWIHAVSLGETRAAAALIERLRQREPTVRLLLTHGTSTGRAEGARLLRAGDMQVWQPWDTPAAAMRFLARFKPRIGILMETEIWPNLCAACQQAAVPLVLANARLSEKSQRKAQRLGWLSRPAYASLAAVWAQTDADAQRLTAVGAKVTAVLGNIKFDATPDRAQLAQGVRWRQAWHAATQRPVVMFASSRAGEESALLRVLEQFKEFSHVGIQLFATKNVVNAPPLEPSLPKGVQWLVVPRHPQRMDEVASLIEASGWRVSRRSDWGHTVPMASAQVGDDTIWLGDSLGEMSLYYGLADAALLGGSFEALGGHNLIEAAACGCPVIMGPHTFNFAEAAVQSINAGAAVRVQTLDQAVIRANGLVHNAASLQAMREATAQFTAAHSGAAEKTVAALLGLLPR